jgi:hypothetical protein
MLVKNKNKIGFIQIHFSIEEAKFQSDKTFWN